MQNYYLGGDVSKGYADFVILNSKKQVVEKNFQLDDTFDGHSRLYERLKKFCKDHPNSTIYAAVESTGGYENNWYNSLLKAQVSLNLKVARLNPLGVRNNSKADLKRIITDKISAKNIAEYLIAHPEKVSYMQEDSLASLRKQWGFIKMLTKQSTQLLNQLESLMYNAQPELLIYRKDGVPNWLLKLMLRYPTSAHLSKAKVKSLAKIPYLSSARANELIAKAKKSIASSTDEITAQLIKATVKQILSLKKTIAIQTAIMAKESSLPEITTLKTFSGINDFSAIGLMLEIQTVERFPSVKKISSFFGLHPVYKTSGDGAGGFRMSKTGRKEPRQILFMVTLCAIRCNPHIRSIYIHHMKKGMPKMSAIGACMHKILRIIYGMLKNNTAFDPEIDLKNRENITEGRKNVPEDKNRRFQNFDPNAPISRRQHMKRKERKPSYSDDITNVRISNSVPLPD